MPHGDDASGVLYLPGKGDNNDNKRFYRIGAFRTCDPRKGGGCVPERALLMTAVFFVANASKTSLLFVLDSENNDNQDGTQDCKSWYLSKLKVACLGYYQKMNTRSQIYQKHIQLQYILF